MFTLVVKANCIYTHSFRLSKMATSEKFYSGVIEGFYNRPWTLHNRLGNNEEIIKRR